MAQDKNKASDRKRRSNAKVVKESDGMFKMIGKTSRKNEEAEKRGHGDQTEYRDDNDPNVR